MIAVKHDLGVLHDRNGKLLRDYDVLIENDELIITDYNGELFEYHPQSLESQRVQETLFHEKQTIIENCLFGVDINPNSVKICRLRLWIELLKNAYYKNATELETLPNIDINIKCGNSLISRFDLDADLGKALRSSRWSMDSYRIAVQTYRNAENKEQKREMERLIADIKGDFKTEISQNSKEQRLYDKISAELYEKHMAPKLFEETLSKSDKANIKKEREKLEKKVTKLKEQLDEIKNNKIYENAFEWRFEFPEVLDDDGKFVGFDVVIGNPPYIRIQGLNDLKSYYKTIYKSANTGNYDIYVLFIEKSIQLINKNGFIQYILPHKFIISDFGKGIRKLLLDGKNISEIIHFGEEMIFEEASTYTCLLQLSKKTDSYFNFKEISPIQLENKSSFSQVKYKELNTEKPWFLDSSNSIINKLYSYQFSLDNVLDSVFSGIQTSADKIYIIEGKVVGDYVEGYTKVSDEKLLFERSILKNMIKGDDIKRYSNLETLSYVIFPYILDGNEAKPIPEEELESKYPKVYQYLVDNEGELRGRERGRMDINGKWFLYNYPKNLVQSNEQKLVSPDITYKMNITVDDGEFCLKNGAYGIRIKKDYQKYKESLIGILNSELMWYFLTKTGNVLRGGYFRFNKKYVLPFPWVINDFILSNIKKTVKKIFISKQENPSADTTALEREIDVLVYRLYGLTYEEVKVVDEEFWMSESEYEMIEN